MTNSKRAARPRRLYGLWIPAVILGMAAGLSGIPIIPCNSPECLPVYRERMRISNLPGLTPSQRAALRTYARSDTCGRCTWAARRTLLQWLLDDGVGLIFPTSQRAS